MERMVTVFVLSLCFFSLAGDSNSTASKLSGTDFRQSLRDTHLHYQQKEWAMIPGGVGTSCSEGSPYSFFVRAGNPKHLLIYFQGGGACWSASTCDVRQQQYLSKVDGTEPPTQYGVFEFSNLENPFRDYTVIFVPYCTGDAHLGNRTVTYTVPAADKVPATTFQVQHKGYANAMAALRWAFANVKSPESVFILGGSAGAIASPFYAGRVAEHYKEALIVQLGDSAGGFRVPAIPKLLSGWGTIDVLQNFSPYRQQNPETINFETLYQAEARHHPAMVFSQFNNAEDVRQISALRTFGIEKVPLLQLLEQNYSEIRQAAPQFRTFTASGELHVIANRPEFYTVAVNGTRLCDWVAALASGRPVKNITVASNR